MLSRCTPCVSHNHPTKRVRLAVSRGSHSLFSWFAAVKTRPSDFHVRQITFTFSQIVRLYSGDHAIRNSAFGRRSEDQFPGNSLCAVIDVIVLLFLDPHRRFFPLDSCIVPYYSLLANTAILIKFFLMVKCKWGKREREWENSIKTN